MNIGTDQLFWAHLFDGAEADGDILQVGAYRSAPINDFWAVMEDGAEYPVESFPSEQEALDWMVGEAISRSHQQDHHLIRALKAADPRDRESLTKWLVAKKTIDEAARSGGPMGALHHLGERLDDEALSNARSG